MGAKLFRCVGGLDSCIGPWGAGNTLRPAFIVSVIIIYSDVCFFKCFSSNFCPACRNMRGWRSWLLHFSCSFPLIPVFCRRYTNITRGIFVHSKTGPRPSGALLCAHGRERNKNATLPEAVTECLTAPRRGARGGEASVFFMLRGLSEEQSGHP